MSKKSVLEMLKNAVSVKAVYVGLCYDDRGNIEEKLSELYKDRDIVVRGSIESFYVYDKDDNFINNHVLKLDRERVGKFSCGSMKYSYSWVDSNGLEKSSSGSVRSLVKVDDSSLKLVCYNGDEIIYSVA